MYSQVCKRCQIAEYFVREFYDVVVAKRAVLGMKRAVWNHRSTHHCLLWKSDIFTTNLTTPCYCSIFHPVYSIMHALPAIPGASKFSIHYHGSNVQILSEINVFVDQESQFVVLRIFSHLDFDCNHHTQYLLANLCVLVYIFRETILIFLEFAVAHWKWICKAFVPAESRFHSKPVSLLFWV